MLDLVELSAKIVLEHGAEQKSSSQIVDEIKNVFKTLQGMNEPSRTAVAKGLKTVVPTTTHTTLPVPSITSKRAIKSIGDNEVKCLICGKGGMTVLKQHLSREHQMTPDTYKEQFGLPKSVSLVANSYHEQRRNIAIRAGLGHNKVVVPTTQITRKASQGRRAEDKNTIPVLASKHRGRVLGSKNKPKQLAHNN